jgi:hypothetical protein
LQVWQSSFIIIIFSLIIIMFKRTEKWSSTQQTKSNRTLTLESNTLRTLTDCELLYISPTYQFLVKKKKKCHEFPGTDTRVSRNLKKSWVYSKKFIKL